MSSDSGAHFTLKGPKYDPTIRNKKLTNNIQKAGEVGIPAGAFTLGRWLQCPGAVDWNWVGVHGWALWGQGDQQSPWWPRGVWVWDRQHRLQVCSVAWQSLGSSGQWLCLISGILAPDSNAESYKTRSRPFYYWERGGDMGLGTGGAESRATSTDQLLYGPPLQSQTGRSVSKDRAQEVNIHSHKTSLNNFF